MSRARTFPASGREPEPAPSTNGRRQRKRRAADVQQLLPLAEATPETVSSTTDSSLPHSAAAVARRLWFCVYLPNMPLEAGTRSAGARAIVEDRQGIHRVLLANTAALDAGVMPGQSANAALALLPALELDERSTLQEQQVLESLAGWLEQFSSCVSMAGENLLLLEVAGSLRLFGGLQSLRQQVSAGLRQQGFAASLAIAPTPLAATWLARAGRRACVRETTNIVPMLRSLPLSCLAWPVSVADALTAMGVTTLGDCLRLPREGFARRFGASRLIELDRALGRLPDPRVSWRAPEPFCADFDMTEEQTDSELLLAICRELLEAHERFLLARQLGTQRLDFSFYHLKAAATTLSIGCTQADRTTKRWFDLLRIRFERLSLPEPVIAVRLEGGRPQALVAESGRLSFAGSRVSGERHSMAQLAERLAARMGQHAINGVLTVAEHRPQQAWRMRNLLAGKASETLALVKPGRRRPLWMLPEPAPLAAEQGYPLHQGRLKIVAGPERIETGWWDDDGIARDYFTAINPRGLELWIFRNRNANAAWYLHGFFG